MNALLDTNILIYYFNGLIDDVELDKKAKAFVSYATLFDLDDSIAQTTIKLRRNFKTKTLDAIIAATALVNNMSVVTNNRSDFEVLGLDVIGINVKL
ncbi:MAG: PIN domain-containing protein [Campylobacterota bacterium]|nr:PIN domain-containing protein [Campylobacterota bacterium]